MWALMQCIMLMFYTICRSTDVQLETCAAYGQVSKEQSVSHYETVKHEENIYDNWLINIQLIDCTAY